MGAGERAGTGDQQLHEAVVDRLVHELSGSGLAGLPAHQQEPEQGAVDRQLEVGVVEHDVGALAAEFQGDLLDVAGGRPRHGPADLRRPGERDLADVPVLGEPRADDRTGTGDDVEYARGKADFVCRPGQFEQGQRRLIVRFQHDRVACGQRRTQLPDCEEQREVPRHDARADPDRLLTNQARSQGRCFDQRPGALERVGPGQGGEMLEVGGRVADQERSGGADGRAVLLDLQCRQLVHPGRQAIGHCIHDVRAIGRRNRPPRACGVRRPRNETADGHAPPRRPRLPCPGRPARRWRRARWSLANALPTTSGRRARRR